jgi:hypothetical protein
LLAQLPLSCRRNIHPSFCQERLTAACSELQLYATVCCTVLSISTAYFLRLRTKVFLVFFCGVKLTIGLRKSKIGQIWKQRRINGSRGAYCSCADQKPKKSSQSNPKVPYMYRTSRALQAQQPEGQATQPRECQIRGQRKRWAGLRPRVGSAAPGRHKPA